MSGWVRHDGDPEVNVTDQGKEFLGEYSEGQQRRAVYQHVTNLESPWENGPTERSNQVLEMQYAVARDAYEPFSEEENDELIWQCDAARNRHNDRSGFSSAQRLMGVNPRLPRSITSDDIIDPLETVDAERDDYQRSHDMRMAATIGFFKADATHRLQVLAKAEPAVIKKIFDNEPSRCSGKAAVMSATWAKQNVRMGGDDSLTLSLKEKFMLAAQNEVGNSAQGIAKAVTPSAPVPTLAGTGVGAAGALRVGGPGGQARLSGVLAMPGSKSRSFDS